MQVGWLAQLVERFVYTEDVGSSSLSSPTIDPLHTDIKVQPNKTWVYISRMPSTAPKTAPKNVMKMVVG